MPHCEEIELSAVPDTPKVQFSSPRKAVQDSPWSPTCPFSPIRVRGETPDTPKLRQVNTDSSEDRERKRGRANKQSKKKRWRANKRKLLDEIRGNKIPSSKE